MLRSKRFSNYTNSLNKGEREEEDYEDYNNYNDFNDFGSFNERDGNLIRWQVDTKEVLEEIENYLKGAILTFDGKGNSKYVVPKDKNLITLNRYGVGAVMQLISNYVSKIHILSRYDIGRIYEILAELGDELRIFFICNYEKIGLNTDFKRSRFGLLILNILHIIESTYRRAIAGKESELINTGRIITQTENQSPLNPNKRPRKFWNPLSW
ncbi:hypothetical protein DRN73_07440 [Candidatus Pacearchaeota archaeon]|nr:MAG: hypothetical protein DRN73_07440 [Candidatus Pacearchaeota archaeon]